MQAPPRSILIRSYEQKVKIQTSMLCRLFHPRERRHSSRDISCVTNTGGQTGLQSKRDPSSSMLAMRQMLSCELPAVS